MGKKLGAAELQQNGFFNRLFPQSTDTVFLRSVVTYLKDKFEDLDRDAVSANPVFIFTSHSPHPSRNTCRC